MAGTPGAGRARGPEGEPHQAHMPGAGARIPPTAATSDKPEVDPDVLRYALERLEAALRARTAPGFRLR